MRPLLARLGLALVVGCALGVMAPPALAQIAAALRGHAASSAHARRGRSHHKRRREPKRHRRHSRDPFPGAFTLPHLGTRIVPGVGVGAIHFPTVVTGAQVLATYGNPPHSRFFITPPVQTENGVITGLDYRRAPSDAKWSDTGISFQFDPGPTNALVEIAVDSPTYSTAKGIRVGSTARQVVDAYGSHPGFGTVAKIGYALHLVDSAGHLIYTDFDFLGSRSVQTISVYDCTAFPPNCAT